jgi:cyclopropane fatty-acyl-phospholipid synthase-like methyltransferase
MAQGGYVHGYDNQERTRLQDQARTLEELLHAGTVYPEGATVLEAGCGVGAQTLALARNSPDAQIMAVDISATLLKEAQARVLPTCASGRPTSLHCRLALHRSTTFLPALSLSTYLGPLPPWRP